MPERPLILASGSAARAQVLRGAGLVFEIVKPDVDEAQLRDKMRAKGADVGAQAAALADAKALDVSRKRPGLAIGADQMLSLDGQAFDKPRDRAEARAHLRKLRGKTHELQSAISLAEGGAVLWRTIDAPRLTMRDFADAALDCYLDQAGDAALSSVGAYQLEGLGAQLFARVEGDYFSILGLPLFPLLAALRAQGVGLR
jgi:septum formation protein